MLILLATQSYAQSDHGNGGDEAERRWNPVKNNLKSWILQGGHLGFKYRNSDTPEDYRKKMLEALELPVEFIPAKDAQDQVQVNGLQKMCRNLVVDQKPRIRCIIESVLLIKDHEFIYILHHEYAGITGFETGSALGVSDYYYTDKLTPSIEAQITYRLVVRPVLPEGYEKLVLRAVDIHRVDANFNVISNATDLKTWIQFISTCDQKRDEVAKIFSDREDQDEQKTYVYANPDFNQFAENLECNFIVMAKAGKYLKRTVSIDSVPYYLMSYISPKTNQKMKPFHLIDQKETGFILKSKAPLVIRKQSTPNDYKKLYNYEFDYLVTAQSQSIEVPKGFNPNFPKVTQDICRKIAIREKSVLIPYKNVMLVPKGIPTEFRNLNIIGNYCLIQKTEKGDFTVSLDLNRSFKLKNVIKLYVPLVLWVESLGYFDSQASLTFDATGNLLNVKGWTSERQRKKKKIFNHKMIITVDGKKYRGTYTAPQK